MAQLFAGTSGFAYPSWKPGFYPDKLPAKKFLEYYSRRLNAVEINYTFRRLAALSTLTGWVGATEPGFVFAPKANMRITHILKLKNAEEATGLFLKTIDPLRSARRLGPILFQLPPTLKIDTGLLGEFLSQLPRDLRYTFEFRHSSWFDDEVFDLLRAHRVALCIADEKDDLLVPFVATSDWGCLRLRRPDYNQVALKKWLKQVRQQNWRDVFVFFKHEDEGTGPRLAAQFLDLSV